MSAPQVEAMFRGMSHQVRSPLCARLVPFNACHGQHALWTTTPDGHQLRLLDIRLPGDSSDEPTASDPGTAMFQRSFPDASGQTVRTGRLLVRCADGRWVEVRRVQQADKREMAVGDWWNGLKLGQGRLVLGDVDA